MPAVNLQEFEKNDGIVADLLRRASQRHFGYGPTLHIYLLSQSMFSFQMSYERFVYPHSPQLDAAIVHWKNQAL